eukprot:7441827-Ditylum_brightwellii.AAC.1
MTSASSTAKNTKDKDPIEITIVDRTPSKLDESESQDKGKFPDDVSIALGVGGSQPSNDLFASCFSATSNKAQQKVNKRCLCHVQAHSAKYIRRMKKHLYSAMQADFDRHIAKIISSVNENTKRAGVSANQSVFSASSNFYETYKRNTDDQEKLPGGLFELFKQLQIFKHNFKIAMHERLHWEKILHIMTKSGV